ncbi:sugar porter (SP) family MFS transporter [Maribacter caenipelagi]|uniref:Sugar porter (SP) family MFS transporter n=1 Tax=Maribacter caenipelagi TaxID=1447781 RepID=A0A4R7CY11_9FLAO|nr:sugar porter family MFS transporter [Maribacter caenipelagi]TDS12827.1 sugar porter (SP) family MFS transporter [Maribacter caenipelagi]
MNRIIVWSITVALAGFLFGFDTVVISGANEPIKQLWNTSPLFHGTFIMSMALWGTVFGSLFGGIPTKNLGRKKTLLWVGILFLVSAVGSALAQDPYSFSAFRFIGGVGVGISTVAAPIYISEITSKENRGKMVGLYQFWLVFGILIAFVSNWLLKGFDGINDWRWMLGVEAIPAFIYTIMVFTVPESPRWLALHKKDDAAALKILEIIHSKEKAAQQLTEIKTDLKHTTKSESLFQKKYSKVLYLAFFIAFFNQLSGINFVLYYAPEILEQAGLGGKESLFNSIAIGIVNLVFTFIGIRLLDKLGRRQLIIIGSIGYIISLIMVGLCFQMDLGSTLTLTFICTFVGSHAIGQGAVIWVFISEIFPNSVRAYGQSWGVSVHWIFAAIITLITPFFLDATEGVLKDQVWYIYYFFCAMMVLQLIWALTKMPETKGVSLEKLSMELVKE